MQKTIEVSSCYIRMSVGLFNWIRKEELEIGEVCLDF